MKKFLALFLVILLVVAVAPAFAVVPMGPDAAIQEPSPIYDGSMVEFHPLEYLTAAPAYAESDSDSGYGPSPGVVEEAKPEQEASPLGTAIGVVLILGFLYLIDSRAKKRGKRGLLERLKNLVGGIGEIFKKRE